MKQQKWATARSRCCSSRAATRGSKGDALGQPGQVLPVRQQGTACPPAVRSRDSRNHPRVPSPSCTRTSSTFWADFAKNRMTRPAAEEYYQKVLEVDYAYRDTVARLAPSLQGGQAVYRSGKCEMLSRHSTACGLRPLSLKTSRHLSDDLRSGPTFCATAGALAY